MTQTINPKQDKKYDLEERCLKFAKRVNIYVKNLPKSMPNIENGKQLIKSAGSVGANYIEANEALSRKDFAMRIKISRKEARESEFWLELTEPLKEFEQEKAALLQEALELRKIFGSILEKIK